MKRGRQQRRSHRSGFESLEARHLLAAEPVITEFMASNQATLIDGDGNSSDWVEIYNPGEQSLNLGGYRLTDDPGNPGKWTFPGVELEPRAYLVVFASGQDRQDYTDGGGHLHTNFRLSSGGEYLALMAPDGSVLSEFGSTNEDYGQQRADVSFGQAQTLVLVDEETDASYLVPNEDIGIGWTQPGFDASARGFQVGKAAVGYEDRPSAVQDFSRDYRTELPEGTTAVYTRVEFNLAQSAAVDALSLDMKYDDGFAVYLNGTLVLTENAPDELTWSSLAETTHRDSTADEAVTYSLPLDTLVDGRNVLAIHAFAAANDSKDMLSSPRLTAGALDMVAAFGLEPQVGYMTEPTPGAPNSGNEAVFSGFVGETTIDVDAGFFEDTFQVNLASGTPGTTIRYTTDGSAPSLTVGATYTGAIPIETTTVLRAASFRDEYVPGRIATRTYIYLDDVLKQDGDGLPETWGKIVNSANGKNAGDPAPANYAMDPEVVNDARYRDTIKDDLRSIPTLSLVMDPDDLWSEESGIYANSLKEGALWERPASVEWIDTDGRVEFRIDAGARMHGGWGRRPSQTNKHSFRLLFKREYGETKLRYPLFGEEGAQEFDTVVLRANFNTSWATGGNTDATFVQDRWAAQTQLEMGWVGPRGNWVHLYVNGLYWGLYNPNERPSAAFAASYFGGDKEEYDSLNNGQAIDGDPRNFNELNRAVRAREFDYEAVKQLLDIDAFIDYMLINQHGGNWDWPHNNWYATHHDVPGGKWYFHTWDAEGVWSSLSEDRVQATGGPGSIFLDLVAKSDDFRMQYADRIQKHFFNGGLLSPEANIERLHRLTEPIDRAVVGESARWGDGRWDQVSPARTRDHWLRRLRTLERTYFPRRNDIVLRQLSRAGVFPDTQAPVLNQHGGAVPAGFEMTFTNPNETGTIFYTLNGEDPRVSGGDLSPVAVEHDGSSIAVNRSLVVRARVLNDGEWSPLTETTFLVDNVLPGDIDQNGTVDVVDINRLCQQVVAGIHEDRADLSRDGIVDRDDYTILVEDLLRRGYGDANHDELFNSSDLIQVFEAGRYEKPELGFASWEMGDWNCDGQFTSSDLVIALMTNRYIADPAPAARVAAAIQARPLVTPPAVPEPTEPVLGNEVRAADPHRGWIDRGWDVVDETEGESARRDRDLVFSSAGADELLWDCIDLDDGL